MKLNKNFQTACQARLDEKSAEYDGKDNPKNYKNMPLKGLASLILSNADDLNHYIYVCPEKNDWLQKLCVDISNRCQMLWERLGENG